jgi:glutathione S-transferase
LLRFAKTGETPATDFLRGRALGSMQIVDSHVARQDFILGKRATIADLSMCGFLYYGDELSVDLSAYPNVQSWIGRIAALPGWKHPYDLMPRGYAG